MKYLITTIATLVLVGCALRMSIHQAARNGDIEVVKQHLAADVDVNAKDKSGWTPLHWAVEYGHAEIAEFLIANDAGVNSKMEGGVRHLIPGKGNY